MADFIPQFVKQILDLIVYHDIDSDIIDGVALTTLHRLIRARKDAFIVVLQGIVQHAHAALAHDTKSVQSLTQVSEAIQAMLADNALNDSRLLSPRSGLKSSSEQNKRKWMQNLLRLRVLVRVR